MESRAVIQCCLLLLMISTSCSLFCDFETDFCNFVVDTDDDYARFLRYSKSTGRFVSNIPITDHTYGNSTGRYAFMKTRYTVTKGHLYSPVLTNTGYKCISFYYQVTGQPNDVELSILALYNDTDVGSSIWTLNGGRGKVWRKKEVSIPTGVYKLAFKGDQKSTSLNGISIDDVNVTSSVCTESENETSYEGMTCDFEAYNICGYQQDSSDDMDWVWSSGTTYTTSTGPRKDHTRTDELGFYMYLEASGYPVVSGHKARIVSPIRNITSVHCIEFWYNMNGRHSERLNVYVKDPKASLGKADWSEYGDHGDKWYRGTVSTNPTLKSFLVVFEAVRGEGEYGDIALDDVAVHMGECPEIPTPAPPLPRTDASCTFEDGWCNYTQGLRDKFDWALYNGDGYRSYALPRVDHTKGNDKGAFLYINPLYSNTVGDDARLVSPLIKQNTDTICLRFYFYINHWSVDKFALYVIPKGESMSLDPFWAVYNTRSSIWQKQDLEIYPQDSDFYIMFVGTKGSSTYPNIALDDITTTYGPCTIITPTPGLPNADCDFEKNISFCGYVQETTDNFDWIWHQGSTGSDNTGPVNDHTIGDTTGHYIYIETSDPRRPDQRAKLTSPTIAGSDEPICLHFWYHMKGDHVGRLTVYKAHTGSYRRSIWSKSGNQGKNWKEATVLINQDYEGSGTYDIVELSFKITIEAMVGSGHRGDIAIDDITFDVGSCKSEEPEKMPITKSCDFESGPEGCGMYQLVGDEFNWIAMNKSSGSRYKRYKKFFKNHGTIMALDLAGKEPNTKAVLVGIMFVTPNRPHCMSLDYVATGDITQRINVIMFKTKSNYYGGYVTKPLKSIVGHTGDDWKTSYISINPKEDNITYSIEGIVGATDQGRIAIDNIKIDAKPCNEIKPDKQTAVVDEPASFGTGIGIGFLICVLVLGCLLIAAYAFHNRKRGLPRYTKELNTNAIFKGGELDPDVNFS